MVILRQIILILLAKADGLVAWHHQIIYWLTARGFIESALLFQCTVFLWPLECFAPLNSCQLTLWVHASAYMHADPCSEGVSWQLLSGANHSSSHKNFAGLRSLENLYG